MKRVCRFTKKILWYEKSFTHLFCPYVITCRFKDSKACWIYQSKEFDYSESIKTKSEVRFYLKEIKKFREDI